MDEVIVQAISELTNAIQQSQINNSSTWNEPNNIIAIIGTVFAFISILTSGYLGYITYKVTKNQKDISEKEMKISERQINLSLYEKRYTYYAQIKDKMQSVIYREKDYTLTLNADIITNTEKFIGHEARFLFDKDVFNHIETFLTIARLTSYILKDFHFLNNSNKNNIDWYERKTFLQMQLNDLKIIPPPEFKQTYDVENIHDQEEIKFFLLHRCYDMITNLEKVFDPYLNFKDIK